MSDWTSEYLKMIEDCEERESRLTDWERNFIQSIKDRMAAGATLSAKQIETIDSIWEKATSRG